MFASISLFLITLIFIIIRPKGLKIGTIAVTGALVAFVAGLVNINDIKEVISIVWDATLAFIGIIILSMVLDEIGFFEWCALKMAKLSNGNGVLMFVYSVLLGALVSALFANDGAALILTPILLAKMKVLRLNAKTILAFLLAGGFISDSASLPFVFSNLTNIVTVNYFDIGFATYLKDMALPFIASVFVSTLVLYLVLRKDIPKRVDVTLLGDPKSVLKSESLFRLSWVFLFILLGAYFIGDSFGLPISLFALGGAFVFLIISVKFKAVNGKKIIKNAPWQVVWFSLGLYVVVYGLKNAGLTIYIEEILRILKDSGDFSAVLGTGFLSAFLSAVMNNMPTVMVMDIALKNVGNDMMVYANIIGCNLGPKMTPFGSLATLLWLHTLEKKGVKIGFWEYSKFGMIVTPVVLFFVLLSLTL